MHPWPGGRRHRLQRGIEEVGDRVEGAPHEDQLAAAAAGEHEGSAGHQLGQEPQLRGWRLGAGVTAVLAPVSAHRNGTVRSMPDRLDIAGAAGVRFTASEGSD